MPTSHAILFGRVIHRGKHASYRLRYVNITVDPNDRSTSRILDTFDELLKAVDLSFEDEATIERALFSWKDSSAQFADCLIGARHQALGCASTATFDSDALKLPEFATV